MDGSRQDEPRDRLRRLLVDACRRLDMDVAFVSTLAEDGTRTIRVAVRADGREVPGAEGRCEPLEETWCGDVVRDGGLRVRDVAERADLQALAVTAEFGIGSYCGVPLLQDDALVGTLCALGHGAHERLDAVHTAALLELGETVAPLLAALDAPTHQW